MASIFHDNQRTFFQFPTALGDDVPHVSRHGVGRPIVEDLFIGKPDQAFVA
jgi:hypothetical protein